jgi:hypothetical protein
MVQNMTGGQGVAAILLINHSPFSVFGRFASSWFQYFSLDAGKISLMSLAF